MKKSKILIGLLVLTSCVLSSITDEVQNIWGWQVGDIVGTLSNRTLGFDVGSEYGLTENMEYIVTGVAQTFAVIKEIHREFPYIVDMNKTPQYIFRWESYKTFPIWFYVSDTKAVDDSLIGYYRKSVKNKNRIEYIKQHDQYEGGNAIQQVMWWNERHNCWCFDINGEECKVLFEFNDVPKKVIHPGLIFTHFDKPPLISWYERDVLGNYIAFNKNQMQIRGSDFQYNFQNNDYIHSKFNSCVNYGRYGKLYEKSTSRTKYHRMNFDAGAFNYKKFRFHDIQLQYHKYCKRNFQQIQDTKQQAISNAKKLNEEIKFGTKHFYEKNDQYEYSLVKNSNPKNFFQKQTNRSKIQKENVFVKMENQSGMKRKASILVNTKNQQYDFYKTKEQRFNIKKEILPERKPKFIFSSIHEERFEQQASDEDSDSHSTDPPVAKSKHDNDAVHFFQKSSQQSLLDSADEIIQQISTVLDSSKIFKKEIKNDLKDGIRLYKDILSPSVDKEDQYYDLMNLSENSEEILIPADIYDEDRKGLDDANIGLDRDIFFDTDEIKTLIDVKSEPKEQEKDIYDDLLNQ